MKRKNYTNIELQEYPRVTTLGNSVFGYIDEIKIEGQSIYIMFLANQNGFPIGKISNTYFDFSDIPNITNPNWLINYKKELLERIKFDIEERKIKSK